MERNLKCMLITGIRHKLNAELDSSRSALFLRYAIHFLQMFAWLGIIVPICIGADYYFTPQTKDEIVTNKYTQVLNDLNQIEYHFITDSYRFLSNSAFYDHTNIKDRITISRTPIFKTVTFVSHMVDQNVYICKPNNIYGWPLIVAGLTFICSIIIIFKTLGWKKKREHVNYDKVVNLGAINVFLCVITIIAILFRVPY